MGLGILANTSAWLFVSSLHPRWATTLALCTLSSNICAHNFLFCVLAYLMCCHNSPCFRAPSLSHLLLLVNLLSYSLFLRGLLLVAPVDCAACGCPSEPDTLLPILARCWGCFPDGLCQPRSWQMVETACAQLSPVGFLLS